MLEPDEALRPANLEVFFELLLFSEFLEVATGLRLLPLLGKLSAGDGGRQQEGGEERKNRESKSENLGEAIQVTIL